MGCDWREEVAYSYSDGGLSPEERSDFERHLGECPTCRGRLAEAERLDGLLRAELTAVTAPPTLAGRLAQAVAREREERRTRFAWPSWMGRRALATALTSLVLAVVLLASGGADSVLAVVQRALLWIPGVGISAVDADNLVAAQPIVVRDGNVAFTVVSLLSDGKSTTVRFIVEGLPGGKAPGGPAGGPSRRAPVLRDEQGKEYEATGAWSGTGGSSEENHLSGGMTFAPLPRGLASVDLVVPREFLSSGIPGNAGQGDWVAHVPLVRSTESGLPRAVPQGASATVRGVTLRVTASSAEPERTVVRVEGEAPGEARVSGLIPNGSDSARAIRLRDGLGNSYAYLPESVGATLGEPELSKSLEFEPLPSDAGELTLSVAAVQVEETGSAELSVGLAGRKPGETFPLDQTIKLGDHEIRLKTATLDADRDGAPRLAVDVDLGPAVDGRTLSGFRIEEPRGGWGVSMGSKDGSQMNQFSVSLAPDLSEVRVKLSHPLVIVEGPWELTFPARGVTGK